MIGGRLLRRAIASLVVLGALFVAANIVVASIAEDRVGDVARVALDLEERPEVDIGAFPIVVRVLQGRIPEATMRARDVRVDGLELASVTVRAREVEFSLGTLASGDLEALRIRRVRATGVVTQAALNRALEREDADATVTFRGDGRVAVRADRVVFGRRRRIVATGRLALADGRIRLEAERITVDGERPSAAEEREARRRLRVGLDVPPLPGGFRVTEIRIREGTLRLVAEVRDYTLGPD